MKVYPIAPISPVDDRKSSKRIYESTKKKDKPTESFKDILKKAMQNK